jgi:hypothetical protein
MRQVFPFAGWFLVAMAVAARGQDLPRQELPTRYAPVEKVKAAVQGALSPEGSFVVLPDKGKVLVIDRAERIAAAAAALAALDVPPPALELNLGVRTGGVARPRPAAGAQDPFRQDTRTRSGFDFPVPTDFDPGKVILHPNGSYVVIPATPTRFATRNLGTTQRTQSIANPDGTITVNIDHEEVEFAGFLHYGSPVLPFGTASVIPLQGRLARPLALQPFLHQGGVQVPVFDTTRISTSVLVYPEETDGNLTVFLVPQAEIVQENSAAAPLLHPFRQFRTRVDLTAGQVSAVRGFQGAPPAFNQAFLADEEHPDGLTELVLKGRVVPGR